MNKITGIIKQLKNNKVKLSLTEEGKLRVEAEKEKLTNELVSLIKANKEPLIDFIKKHSKEATIIPAIEAAEDYALSPSQERMWINTLISNTPEAYVISKVLNIKGSLDLKFFQQAFDRIIERHEILRTVFREGENGEVRQSVQDISSSKSKVLFLEAPSEKQKKSFIDSALQDNIQAVLDLTKGPLISVSIVKGAKNDYYVLFSVHHIICDGWSINNLAKELFQNYQTYQQASSNKAKPLRIQYKDYAAWQLQLQGQEEWKKQESYWLETLKQPLPKIDLPLDYQRPLEKDFKGGQVTQTIPPAALKELKDYCQKNGVSLFTGLITLTNTLLNQYTDQDDIIIGVPVAGRDHADLSQQIGFYVNTIPVRTQFQENQSFKELLSLVHHNLNTALENQNFPFEKIVKSLNLQRDRARNPLFDVMVVHQGATEFEQLGLTEMRMAEYPIQRHTTLFDLTFEFKEYQGALTLNLYYSRSLFKAETIERLAGHFSNLLLSITQQDHLGLSQLSLLSAEEHKRLIQSSTGEQNEFPREETLLSLFEQQAKRTPTHRAVVFDKYSLSYAELDKLSNQMAAFLLKKATIAPEDLIGIQLERSEWLIIAILGIYKTGVAYVPIDPAYPESRINFIAENSQCKLMIDQALLEEFITCQHTLSGRKVPVALEADSLAYVIYTSGSTGQPKGCMVEHGGVVNYVTHQINTFEITPTEHILFLTNISFDPSVEQIFIALLSGASLYIVDKDLILDEKAFADYINEQEITHIHSVPSLLRAIQPQPFNYLKRIVAGGEQCPADLAEDWAKYHDFYNKYGPTEATITATQHKVTLPLSKGQQSISIGRPVANTKVYILNDALQMVPVGVPGEIYIGGVGVSRGYLNQEKLTAERFLADPFEAGGRMYKTGDIAKRLSSGNIEFIGRKDSQVKVRGHRVELGEINAKIKAFSSIKDSVTLFDQSRTEARLIAFFMENDQTNIQELKAYLSNQLPAYMQPSALIAVDHFPLTPNGKADQQALLKMAAQSEATEEKVEPETETEIAVAKIWQRLIGIEKVGKYDDFFVLGGHSLLAMRMVAAIRQTLSVELSVRDLFTYTSLFALSNHIDGKERERNLPPVTSAEFKENTPLSYAQERLWFIDKLQGSSQYHMPEAIRLKGALEVEHLENSIRELIDRHEVLRTVVREKEGVPFQQVLPATSWKFTPVDRSKGIQANDIDHQLKQLLDQTFDLSEDYMLRARLVDLGEEEFLLIIVLHHIASDGWSRAIFVKELLELYNAKVQGRSSNLRPLAIQYKDYAVWQKEHLNNNWLEKELSFWKNKLEGIEPVNLPLDFTRPSVQRYHGATLNCRIDNELSKALDEFSKENEATLFMLLLSVFYLLLNKYSGQEKLFVGVPVANRGQQELESLIGFFVNTVIVPANIKPNARFVDILKQVKENTLQVYKHQNVPFEKIVEQLEPKRDLSRNPLFQIAFTLLNLPERQAVELEGVRATVETLESETSKFDLSLNVFVDEQGIELQAEYCTDLFKGSTVERFLQHYQELIKSCIEEPKKQIASFSMLTAEEEYQLLHTFNDTLAPVDREKSIPELIEAQSLKFPDKIAIEALDGSLTYQQLNERSNQLAHYLLAKGLTPGALVAVCLERNAELIIALLAILKAGGAYVPLDLNYPEERISYILEDSAAPFVISDASQRERFAHQPGIELMLIDEQKEEIESSATTALAIDRPSDDLAYVIYTSGSTGKPKGVMITNLNLQTFIAWCKDEFSESQFEVVFGVTSICFDLSIFEIFFTLCIGKQLRLLNDALEIEAQLDSSNQILLNTVPGVIQSLLEEGVDLSNVSVINMAGEPIPQSVIDGLDIDRIEVRNLYGPSEDTTYSTIYRFTEKQKVLIGKPVGNTRVYLLDDQLNLVPYGAIGELCLSGLCVSKGYLNRPELTAEKFIDNPFSIDGHTKLYKTGDLARWLPDGNLDFIGRKDTQIKLRGYRIELGEIEIALEAIDWVHQAVVLLRETQNGDKHLVAYVVQEQEKKAQELKALLSESLPKYMVPGVIVMLDELPRTPNGKIDKRALPEPLFSEEEGETFTAPATKSEKALAKIWQRLLKREKVGVHQDFFELGGHSLLANRVIAAAHKELGVDISVKDLFSYPSLHQLAALIDASEQSTNRMTIEVAERPKRIPLSYTQERLWFIDQLQGSTQYHMSEVLRLTGPLNVEALEYALNVILHRHEVLRTVIREEEGVAYQDIKEAKEWQLNKASLKQGADATEINEIIQQQIEQPFDLAEDYMLRAQLLKVTEEEHLLVIVVHHIACDGWSLALAIGELVKLYASKDSHRHCELPELEIQYADFAIWQKGEAYGKRIDQQLEYWKKQLKEVSPLALQTDYVRPLVQSTNGAKIYVPLDGQLHVKLQERSKELGVTLYMTLLAAYKVLLYRYTQQNDICVGTPVAGRNYPEIENLIGFFVNILAIRTQIQPGETFSQLVQKVKNISLDAFANQEVPFERIVESTVSQRDLSRSPIFEVTFGFNNNLDLSNGVGGGQNGYALSDTTHLTAEPIEVTKSTYDINLDIDESENGLTITAQYCSDLFHENSIQAMVGQYIEILSSIVRNPEQQIEKINLLSKKEQQVLLGEKPMSSGEYLNASTVELNNNLPINLRFEQIASSFGKECAVIHEEVRWTFDQLNSFANQLGQVLADNGLTQPQFAGVYLERSPELIACLLGIIKSGGVYVPLDTNNPSERVEAMIAESELQVLITNTTLVDGLSLPENTKVLLLDTPSAQWKKKAKARGIAYHDIKDIKKASTGNLANTNEMDSWAYMLFTSGSTGKPKGAITRHDGALNHLLAEYTALELKDGFRFLQSAGIGSDISVWQMLGPILKGGAAVIVDKFDLLDYENLIQILEKEQLSLIEFVPAYIWGLVEYIQELPIEDRPAFADLKWIMMVGEAVPVKLVNSWRSLFPHVRVLNGYGPCEASDDIAQYEIKETLDERLLRVPIGRPLQNMNIFILDSNTNLCPIGVPGELCVSGIGVGAGYWKLPQKTAERFISNPFPETLGTTLYKTGDLAKWRHDGQLEFLGRIDRQVKIRGHRVELGEIESFIRKHPVVTDCHVMVAKGEKEAGTLATFMVADESKIIDNQQVLSAQTLQLLQEQISNHKEALPDTEQWLCTLDNGLQLFHRNKSETLFAYNEIFEENAYLRHGITLEPGSVVFDLGANIGVFSAFIAFHFPNSTIYAFEPLPPTFESMHANSILFSPFSSIKAYCAGISNKRQQVTFTHYPENTMLSGRYGDLSADKAYVRNVLERQLGNETNMVNQDIDYLVDKAMDAETYDCELVSLSEIIAENGVEKIDLLKIDVERSELDVLAGIKPADWPKIRQIVIEVHDDGESLDKVIAIMEAQNFKYYIEQETLLVGTDLYNIYASRDEIEPETAQVIPKLVGTQNLEEEIRQLCTEALPDYMNPDRYHFLESIPLNLSDKVDEKALQQIHASSSENVASKDQRYTAPTTEAEILLSEIWMDLLNLPRVGITDDFFEIGGHSLKATQLVARIYKAFGRKVSIREVFSAPTIEAQTQLLQGKQQEEYLSIPKIAVQPFYPTSNAQKRLWIIAQIEEELIAYNSYSTFRMTGELNIPILEQSILDITRRHEILRTTIVSVNGEPMQKINTAEELGIHLEVVDARMGEWTEDQVKEALKEKSREALDMEKGPLFKTAVFILPDNTYYLLVLMHHIICDGWSSSLFVKEVLTLYKNRQVEEAYTIQPELPIQYKDYASWQTAQLASPEFEDHRKFWFKTFEGELPVLQLPSYKQRPAVQTYEGLRLSHTFSNTQLQYIKDVAAKADASLFMALTALLNVLFYKHTAQRDIIIGAATAGRNHPDLEHQLGYYINTVALRNEVKPEQSFLQFLQEVKETTLLYLEHEDYPFDVLINELDYDRDVSRNPLFDVLIVLQNIDDTDSSTSVFSDLTDLEIQSIELERISTHFDLDFDFRETEEGLALNLSYNIAIYEQEQIEALLRHFSNLIDLIGQTTSQTIGQMDLLGEAEREHLIYTVNDTKMDLPLEVSFIHYLEKFAELSPDHTVVKCNGREKSYSELNKDCNRMGRYIQREWSIGPNDLVAVFMHRSERMMASCLSIWKAGGAFIPIERRLPDKRIISVLKNAGVKLILTEDDVLNDSLRKELENICPLTTYGNLFENSREEKEENLDVYIDPKSLSYVIFTSGSTGQPKGAMVQHIGMMNHALASEEYLKMNTQTVLVQNASHAFDISIWQFFNALIRGGQTLVYDDQMVRQPELLWEDLKKNKATILKVVPSYLSLLLEIIEADPDPAQLSLTHIICGGEVMKPDAVRRWFNLFPQVKAVNDYGPAEASDGTSWYVFDSLAEDVHNISVGTSICNMSTYVVDENENICPVGVIGEIYVAGVGVGLGYLNDEERTKEKFADDSFAPNKQQRLYKTGDLGRYLPDGKLEFHGRRDYQVKINGQRIELGEIEAILTELPSVKEVAVIDKVDPRGKKYLIGFIVFNKGKERPLDEFRSDLSGELAGYMIPRVFHQLEKLPLTQNGKLNRKELGRLAAEVSEDPVELVLPENDIEKLLAESWKNVLSISEVSVKDNFYDLGGDSISAIQVASQLFKAGYKLEIRDIMRQTTIQKLAPFVKPLQQVAEQSPVTGDVPLTPIQLSFFNDNKKVPNHFNQDTVIKSKIRLDVDKVRETLKKLQELHDALRMRYRVEGETVKQYNAGLEAPLFFQVVDLKEATNPLAEMTDFATEVHASKELEAGSLMKAVLFHLPTEDHLLISIHHLVVDGVSWRILLEDFEHIYGQLQRGEAVKLPMKTDSFKDWAEQQQKYIYTEKFKEEKFFWQSVRNTTASSIPVDFSDLQTPYTLEGLKSYSFKLDKEHTELLLTKARTAFNTNINDLLIAALGMSVEKQFQLQELTLMMESHGRASLYQHTHIDRTVGWFTTEYPIHLKLDQDQDLSKLIKTTKECLHKVPNYGLGYGLLNSGLIQEGKPLPPKPQIIFNYLGQVDNIASEGDFEVYNALGRVESMENEVAYMLEVTGVISDGQLEITLTYHAKQFAAKTIRYWMDAYQESLEELITYCTNRLEKELTPSDFDLKDLSLDDFEELESIFEG